MKSVRLSSMFYALLALSWGIQGAMFAYASWRARPLLSMMQTTDFEEERIVSLVDFSANWARSLSEGVNRCWHDAETEVVVRDVHGANLKLFQSRAAAFAVAKLPTEAQFPLEIVERFKVTRKSEAFAKSLGVHETQVMSDALGAAAEATDVLGASFASYTLRKASGTAAFFALQQQYEDGDDDVYNEAFESFERKETQAMNDVIFKGVVARVLCEAAPASFFGIAFLALSWDSLSPWARTKTCVSLFLSMSTCLQKSAKCFAMGSQISKLVGFAICLWVSIMTFKFVGLFTCPDSHMLNLISHGCVAKITNATEHV